MKEKNPKTKPKLKDPKRPKTTHHNPNPPKPTTAPAPCFCLCLDEPFTHWEKSKAILYQEPAKAEYLRKEGIFVRWP